MSLNSTLSKNVLSLFLARLDVRSWRPYSLLILVVYSYHIGVPLFGQAIDPVDSQKVLNLKTFATYTSSSSESTSAELDDPSLSNVSAAIDLDHPKDGSGRIFVSTNEGIIHAYSSSGTPLGVFLDMAEPDATPDFERSVGFTTRGLSYIAFHPDYGVAGSPGEGKLYTLYKTKEPGESTPDYSAADLPTKPGDVLSQFAIAEWTVDSNDPNRIDISSRREVIRFELSGNAEDTHGVGQIAFNPFDKQGEPDYGILYIPLGDMYSGGYLHNWQHVQDEDNPFGKILRINPLAINGDPYSIPTDNPFADGGSLLDDDGITEEIASVGFRYPQNLSFAKDSNGNIRLLVFDIGADKYEELNIVDIGDNHGWTSYDGHKKVNRDPDVTTMLNPSEKLRLEFPAGTYDHNFPTAPGKSPTLGGTAIAGGFVVSDPDDATFQSQVLFGDLARGSFFHADFNALVSADAADTQATLSVMHVTLDGSRPGSFPDFIGTSDRGDVRFGVDESGRVFLVSRRTNVIYLTDMIADQPYILALTGTDQ